MPFLRASTYNWSQDLVASFFEKTLQVLEVIGKRPSLLRFYANRSTEPHELRIISVSPKNLAFVYSEMSGWLEGMGLESENFIVRCFDAHEVYRGPCDVMHYRSSPASDLCARFQRLPQNSSCLTLDVRHPRINDEHSRDQFRNAFVHLVCQELQDTGLGVMAGRGALDFADDVRIFFSDYLGESLLVGADLIKVPCAERRIRKCLSRSMNLLKDPRILGGGIDWGVDVNLRSYSRSDTFLGDALLRSSPLQACVRDSAR